jgi:hypothetical protein
MHAENMGFNIRQMLRLTPYCSPLADVRNCHNCRHEAPYLLRSERGKNNIEAYNALSGKGARRMGSDLLKGKLYVYD